MTTPTCHPERAHQALGLCAQCYMQQYDKRRNPLRRKKPANEYSPNYRKPPTKPKRAPECHPERKHVALGLCSSCYQKDRPDRKRASCHPGKPMVADGLCNACLHKRRYDEAPEVARERARAHGSAIRGRLRTQMVEAYGGQCACVRCPETNTAFLTLDHINGDGRAHRRTVGSHTYADLRRRGWPQEGYRLLCWNCNAMTRFGRTCPHEESED